MSPEEMLARKPSPTHGAALIRGGLALLFGFGLLLALMLALFGLASLAGQFQRGINLALGLLLLLEIVILCPMAAIRKTRGFVGMVLFNLSYLAGLLLWLRALLLAYILWGLTSVIIGLVFAGVGVLPVAVLACLFKGQWPLSVELIVLLVLVLGTRWFGFWCSENSW